jgi:hypothetical protein
MAELDLIFVGPTAYGLTGANAGALLKGTYRSLPPIVRGMLPEVLIKYPKGRVIIVDGAFYHAFSVDHREILSAISAGREVLGLSSMGALRAVELAPVGMRGFGVVWDAIRQFRLDDDEVMVLHDGDYPYRPVTVPLIEVRAALGSLWLAGLVDTSQVAAVIDILKRKWFGDRNWSAVRHALEYVVGFNEPVVTAAHQALQSVAQLKRLDLAAFLTGSPARRMVLAGCGALLPMQEQSFPPVEGEAHSGY